MLTGTYQRGGWLALVIAFDGGGGDVVQQTGPQASHHIGGLLPVQDVFFAVDPAQGSIFDGKPTDKALGGFRLIPAQLHLVLFHAEHVETGGRQQVWEQWQPHMSNPYIE